jgi:hypothetical protein
MCSARARNTTREARALPGMGQFGAYAPFRARFKPWFSFVTFVSFCSISIFVPRIPKNVFPKSLQQSAIYPNVWDK